MANMNIRVDDNLKQQAEAILVDIGLSTSAAMTVFLKQIVRCNGMPFELKADPFFSVENQTKLLKSMERMDKTGGTIHELIEVDDD